jgi:hypothetical protein
MISEDGWVDDVVLVRVGMGGQAPEEVCYCDRLRRLRTNTFEIVNPRTPNGELLWELSRGDYEVRSGSNLHAILRGVRGSNFPSTAPGRWRGAFDTIE